MQYAKVKKQYYIDINKVKDICIKNGKDLDTYVAILSKVGKDKSGTAAFKRSSHLVISQMMILKELSGAKSIEDFLTKIN